MTRERLDLGRRSEEAAGDHLQRSGYAVVARNFRSRAGEIDLVAEKAGTLVFVEVRCRRDDRFGTAAESVTSRKRRRLCLAAELYLQRLRAEPAVVRFDVIAVEWHDGKPQIDHIESAFDC